MDKYLSDKRVEAAVNRAVKSITDNPHFAQTGEDWRQKSMTLEQENEAIRKKLDKVTKELEKVKKEAAREIGNFNDAEDHKAILKAIVGNGYAHDESGRRLLRMHAAAIVEKIQATAKGDLLGQMQLAEAVKRRLSPANFEPDKDLYVALAIAESIRAWMKELKSKYHGRFPNEVRAAYRAVHQAVATACSDPQYKGILDKVSTQDKARLLDTSRKMLEEERDRFAHFLEGDIEHLVELRGKMRSDKFPEEWADFIVAAWLSEHCTRESERTSDEIRNPNSKKDLSTYRIHWLELKVRRLSTSSISLARSTSHPTTSTSIINPAQTGSRPRTRTSQRCARSKSRNRKQVRVSASTTCSFASSALACTTSASSCVTKGLYSASARRRTCSTR